MEHLGNEKQVLRTAFIEIAAMQEQCTDVLWKLKDCGAFEVRKAFLPELLEQLQKFVDYSRSTKELLVGRRGGGGIAWIEESLKRLIDKMKEKLVQDIIDEDDLAEALIYLTKSREYTEELLSQGLYDINLGDMRYREDVKVCEISGVEDAVWAMDDNSMNPLEHFFYREPHRMMAKWSHYHEVYHTYFQKYRGRPVTVLEIGVYGGGSLQMWKKYFGPGSRIVGIDIMEECRQYEEEQIRIYIGSQEDRDFLRGLVAELGVIDIVIDDGGHFMNQQIVTFEELFPKLAEGGVYICEDMHTSYWPAYGGGVGTGKSFVDYSHNFIDSLNARYSVSEQLEVNELTRSIHGIHYYDSMIVLEKRKHKPSMPFWIESGER